MRFKKTTLWLFTRILISSLFGVVIATMVFDIRLAEISSDIHAYVANYNRHSKYLSRSIMSPIDFVLREVPFHFVYEEIAAFLNDPYLALRIFSFFSAATILFVASGATAYSLPLALFILVHPRVLDIFASQQRVALALAIAVIGVQVSTRIVRWGLILTASTFHTYIFNFAFVVSGLWLRSSFKSTKWRLVILFVIGLLSIVFFVIAQQWILAVLGDRRASYGEIRIGVYYVLMFAVTFSVIMFLDKKIWTELFGFLVIVSFVSAVVSVFLGLYWSRWIGLALIFLALSGFSPRGQALLVFGGVYGLNLLLGYYFWLG